MPLVRISAKILLLVSADACSHMISGNITFTNTNLCYETCFTMQDYFKVKTDLSNIIRVFAFCAVENQGN